jgi:lysozyme family protein
MYLIVASGLWAAALLCLAWRTRPGRLQSRPWLGHFTQEVPVDFEQAFDILVRPSHEGGFQKNPKDRGNWTSGKIGVGELKGTKYGVSAMSYPGEDIENLTLDRAKTLFRRDFWGPALCDALPQPIRFDAFDTAINSGPQRSIKLLQEALGVTVDGVVGPKTMLALSSIEPYRLVARFNGARMRFITGQPDAWWDEFGKGLMNRIATNLLGA